jgi:hypothetical protein
MDHTNSFHEKLQLFRWQLVKMAEFRDQNIDPGSEP